MTLTRRAANVVIVLFLCVPALHAQELFRFRNGFWINLHHYLYAEALAQPEAGTARTNMSARTAIEHAPCDALAESERPAWQQAVKFYAEHYASRDWLFDDDMRRLNDVMGDAENSHDVPSGTPSDLAEQLRGVAAIYRARCWTAHQRANARWIAALTPRLAEHGQAIATRLAEIYQSAWPRPVVDVVGYANWSGAYTYDAHITVESANPDYQDDSALEMIFHESSHAFRTRLFDDLEAALEREHQQLPRNFDHVIIFFTAGVVTQNELRGSHPDYIPYADRLGIYRRVPGWSAYEGILQQAWRPYLKGKTSRKAALAAVAHALAQK